MNTIELWVNPSAPGLYQETCTTTTSLSATIRVTSNRVLRVNWESVDWSKSNRELASLLGVGYQSVLLHRHGAGRSRSKTKWDSVDWSKTNGEIAQQLGVKYGTVAVRRHLAGVQPSNYESKWASYNWASLDWKESNNELARRTGINPGTIRHFRIKLGFPRPTSPLRGVNVKITQEMIEAADWTFKRDQDLALEWGVSRERVRQVRDHHKKPQCDFKNQTVPSLAVLRWISENKSLIEGKHLYEVIPLLPKTTRGVQMRALRKTGVSINWTFSHPNMNEHVRIVNWELPNIVLAMIWRDSFGINGLATTRGRFNCGKSKWNIQGWKGQRLPDDLVIAIDAELIKARAAGITPHIEDLKAWVLKRINGAHAFVEKK